MLRKSILLCLFSAFCCLPTQAESPADLCKVADQAFIIAEQIKGQARKARVPCKVQTREAIQSYIVGRLDEEVPEVRMQAEEFALKAVGILPEDFNYKRELIDLYTSQIGGYYDPKGNYFVMAGWMGAGLQQPVAVHELTHALQDQYYNLDTFLSSKDANNKDVSTDQLLARSALIEGDATAVMIDATLKEQRMPPLAQQDNIDLFMLQFVLSSKLVGSASKGSQNIMSMMIFPYSSGLRFVHAVLRKSGYSGIVDIFHNPPANTQAILHPELFLSGKSKVTTLLAEDLLKTVGREPADLLHQDSLGEFITALLLESLGVPGAESSSLAAAWQADKLLVLGGAQPLVVWQIQWKDAVAAKNFNNVYMKSRCNSAQAEACQQGGMQIQITLKGNQTLLEIKRGAVKQSESDVH